MDLGIIIGVLLCLTICNFLYTRLRYPFWSRQPVYHSWDVKYWIGSGTVIKLNLPIVNRYVNLETVETRKANTLSEIQKNQVLELVRSNYLRTDLINYKPTKTDFFAYLMSDQSYVSTWSDDKLKGVLTCRSLEAALPSHGVCKIGYVDNLTVMKGFRKKGIAPELIQTYLYHNANSKGSYDVHIFKREGQHNIPIVPLVEYETWYYYSYQLSKPSKNISQCGVNELASIHSHLQTDFEQHKIRVHLAFSELLRLISLHKFHILKCSKPDGSISSFLIVRYVPSFDSDNRPLLEVAYFLNLDPTTNSHTSFNLLINGLSLIIKSFVFGIERVGCLATNPCTLEIKPYNRCKMAYFLHNFACPTAYAQDCLVLI